jgi:hypothetical protein
MAQGTTNRDQFGPESERAKEFSSEQAAQVARDSLSLPDWLSLDDHEELLWEDSPSFKTVLLDLGLSIVIAGIGMMVASIGAVQLLANSLQHSAGWWSSQSAFSSSITARIDGGIMRSKAIYRRWDGSTTQIEMRHICGILCEQSWLDRQFSCADLKVGWSEDGTQKTTYPAVSRPYQVKKWLFKVAEEPVRKTSPDSVTT